MGFVLDTVGKLIARYLQKEVPGYEPFTPSDPARLHDLIQPGDVLLVEGNNRISGIIKYLTQSTWSHAALYVGPIDGASEPDGEPHTLIEANVGEGVVTAPLSKYFTYHTRLCRPVGLSYEDRTTVCRYAINRVGFGYDTKNIVDLMRFLIPLPIPQRWRRRMIALGSGDPTKIIHFERVLAGREPRPVANAEQMRVHRDRRFTERDVEHHIRGLAADAG